MSIRFGAIAACKWVVSTVVLIAFLRYVMTPAVVLPYIVKQLIIWVLMGLVALPFAEWALHVMEVTKKEVAWLIGIWFGVSLLLEALYEWYFFYPQMFILRSTDLYIQYAFEIIAILLIARGIRSARRKKFASEGMVS